MKYLCLLLLALTICSTGRAGLVPEQDTCITGDCFNGTGVHRYARTTYWDSSVYIGSFKAGKRHGKGVLFYGGGTVYVGDWQDDQKHGQGKQIYGEGFWYEGGWVNGKREGYATDRTDYNGETYAGMYENDRRHGKGRITHDDGRVWVGKYKYGVVLNGAFEDKPAKSALAALSLRSDPASPVLPDGSHCIQGDCRNGTGVSQGDDFVYSGTFREGRLDGKGTMVWTDGEVHVGDFHAGSANGQGTRFYVSGNRYTGAWKGGVKQGHGTYSSASCTYTGNFDEGRWSGRGKAVWANGDVYEGEFLEGKANGQGKMAGGNGSRYEGEWKRGFMEGYGTYYDLFGGHYTGMFAGGQENGQGTHTARDGSVRSGTFVNGSLAQTGSGSSSGSSSGSPAAGQWDTREPYYQSNQYKTGSSNSGQESDAVQSACMSCHGTGRSGQRKTYDRHGNETGSEHLSCPYCKGTGLTTTYKTR